MTNDPLHERGQALEDLFFKDVDAKLLDQLKFDVRSKDDRKALANASGISDTAALDALLAQRINAHTLSAVAIVPLIAVAWADGVVAANERSAIERACRDEHIDPDSPQFALIQSWLDKRPTGELLNAWKAYVHALRPHLDRASINQMKVSIVGRARNVAQSTGGFLGLRTSISPSEQRILEDLEAAFN